jgi:hypothetical protein
LVGKFKRRLKTDVELRNQFEFELDHFASKSLINFNKRGNSSPSDTNDNNNNHNKNKSTQISLITQDSLQFAHSGESILKLQ